MKWIHDSCTTKELRHRWRSKTVEMHNYKCPYCKGVVTVEGAENPPLHCPTCGANMRGKYHE